MHSVAEPRTPLDAPIGRRWLIVSGEYPPRLGGVGDYTRLIAERLAVAGDDVEVATSLMGVEERDGSTAGVRIRSLPGHFGLRALWRLERAWRSDPERILYVQYVPHAFGMKAMNVPFCVWMWCHRSRGLRVMFHEVAFPLRTGQPLRHRLLAHVTRMMARLVASAAAEIYVSIPAWRDCLVAMGTKNGSAISVCPVPCTLPGVEAHKARPPGIPGAALIGHFGTYAPSIVDLLQPVLDRILNANDRVSIALIGRNANGMRDRLVAADPGRHARITALDGSSGAEIARAIKECTLMVQPYPDGVSSRRSTAMAALACGVALVTTNGPLTDDAWRRNRSLLMSPVHDAYGMIAHINRLLENAAERNAMAERGRALYDELFAVEHTIARLRQQGR